ncbi:MAG: glutaminyl-peptide cyclotransferase [Bryobacterales bacterium]|nr:glutaminyl-peptide cyclotransferase [Bryobacterales bacterium]
MRAVLLASLALCGCLPAQTPISGYRVVRAYPHDRAAFTQGLQYVDGVLYEGTGLNGRSSIRKVKLETGAVLQQAALPQEYFGEGITVLNGKLFQLTWTSGIGFVYDVATFRPLETFRYTGEGWGLTNDGRNLILSDGSAALRYFDPKTLRETARLTVTDAGAPVRYLNELEFVKGEVWANVWQSEKIARISPMTGKVLGWVDVSGLLTPAERNSGVDVLNGIAYDAKGDRLFVTGKLWPRIFEIKVVPASRR